VISAELVTDPVGPVVPWVLADIGPVALGDAALSGQMPPAITAGPY
jgi:hypothetical protein